jgi:translation initiation factor IF-2
MAIRQPIVTIMGHIDHGKTTLLDKIRSANVCAKEAGGITQHIGSYSACGITFIDTPGHAAFINMRSRGAQITDIIVLVIAGTEGIMAQTKECLNLIKKLNTPFIVALNKKDLPNFSPDKVKGQLVEAGFTPEEYGGDVPVIPISAKSGEGIDKLLETIKMIAELLQLKAEPDEPLIAPVIESKMDKNKGPLATVIVEKGTIRLGDTVFAGDICAKVKALIDHTGKNIPSAGPSIPVEILGFIKVPEVGSVVSSTKIENIAVKQEKTQESDTPKLKIILKADTQGTLEAIKGCLTNDVVLVQSGVGAISDNDVFMASAGKTIIYAFNTKTPSFIQKLAENEKVKIIESKIIYEIIDDIQDKILHLLEPTIDETIVGEAQIIAEFKIEKVRIAGVKITKGEIAKGDLVHIKREDGTTKDTKVEGIRQGKNIVDKVKVGIECGMTFKPYVDFKIKDAIIAFTR